MYYTVKYDNRVISYVSSLDVAIKSANRHREKNAASSPFLVKPVQDPTEPAKFTLHSKTGTSSYTVEETEHPQEKSR